MKVVVIAPHPDDETIGCGGTVLRHLAEGDDVTWVIVTSMHQAQGYTQERITQRQQLIDDVCQQYPFTNCCQLNFPTTQLDVIPLSELVAAIYSSLTKSQAEVLYIPYVGDVHTDHRIVFNAAIAASKSFRLPTIKRILCYETVSETNYSLSPDVSPFNPNVFIDISEQFARKLQLTALYSSELADFPFPRSQQAMTALAKMRGSQSGYAAAEGFVLLKERI